MQPIPNSDQQEIIEKAHNCPYCKPDLKQFAKEIPQEEWDKLPDDLNDNLDHYLYGTPKK